MAAGDWTQPTDSDDYTDYRYQRKFTRELEKRACAIGNSFIWYRTSAVWSSGTITGMTATVLTDSTRADGDWVKSSGECSGARWTNWHCEPAPFQAPNYSVIINGDSRDETQVLTFPISSNDDKTLTFGPNSYGHLADYVVAGYIPSISWCVGKRFEIVNRQCLSWADRMPAWPTDSSWEIGDGSAVTSFNVSATLSSNLAGKSIYYGSGLSTSASIVENSTSTVVIPRPSTTPSGSFEIREGDGTVLFSGTLSGVQDGLQRPGPLRFNANIASGKELLIYGPGGLKRIAITGATPTTMLIARQSYNYGGSFVVVTTGDRGWPGKQAGYPLLAYGGCVESFYNVRPDDDFSDPSAVSAGPMPIAQKGWNEPHGETGECELVYHNAYDLDVWSEIDEDCQPSDKCYSPDMFKSPRGWQIAIEGMVQQFIRPDVNYTGRKQVNNFTLAGAFRYCGINSFTTTTTPALNADSSAAIATWTFAVPYSGVGLVYEITDGSLDKRYTSGGWIGTDGSLTLSFDPSLAGTSMTMTGSLGWTQYLPREFSHPYGRTAFIPDIDPGDGLTAEPSVIDPAHVKDYCGHDDEGHPLDVCAKDPFGVGQWVYRGPSTTYAEVGGYQSIGDGGTAFVTGELARFTGDNWDGPGIDPMTHIDSTSLDIGYWRNFSVMRRRPEQQRIIDESKRGQATSGAKWFLRDSSKNWHAYPFGTGSMKTHSGTTTSGTSTSVTDSLIADEENEERCYFASDRFVGFSAAFKGFTLEVDPLPHESSSSSSSDVEATFKYPIVSATQSGVVTIPSYCGANFTAGQTYRIKEPHCNLNWWQGRTLKITQPNGTVVTTTITGNDADTLFFAPLAQPIEEGAEFEIIELKIGGTYRWNGSEWVAPTGTDSRGSVPFHANPTENAETMVKRYGRFQLHQYMMTVNWVEMYKMINAMQKTRRGAGGWRSCADGVTPECHSRYLQFAPSWQNDNDCNADYLGDSRVCCATTFSQAVGVIRAYDTTHCFVYGYQCDEGCTSGSYSIPHVEARAEVNSYSYANASVTETGNISGVVDTQSGYLTYSSVPKCLPCTVDIMLFAQCPYPSPDGNSYNLEEEGPFVGGIVTHRRTKSTFNSYGVSVLDNKWCKLETQTPDSTGSGVSGKVGAVDLATTGSVEIPAPTYPAFSGGSDPEEVRSLTYSGDGFDITDQCLICTWDFS